MTAWKTTPEYQEIPQPDPGPGQVLVKVGAAGICHSDVHVIHEFDAGVFNAELPFTLGHENAGWVEALGPGATGFEVGEAVAVYGPLGCGSCARCQTGDENICDRCGRPARRRMGSGRRRRDGAVHARRPCAPARSSFGDLDPVTGGAAHRRRGHPVPRDPPIPATSSAPGSVAVGDRDRRARSPGRADPASCDHLLDGGRGRQQARRHWPWPLSLGFHHTVAAGGSDAARSRSPGT